MPKPTEVLQATAVPLNPEQVLQLQKWLEQPEFLLLKKCLLGRAVKAACDIANDPEMSDRTDVDEILHLIDHLNSYALGHDVDHPQQKVDYAEYKLEANKELI